MNFLKKIFSSVFLTISLYLLIYTFYKSEIHHNALQRDYYLNYYIISSLLIILSIITFFINQKIKEYLIISFISVIMCLYVFEGYLTVQEQILKKQLSEDQLLDAKLLKELILKEQIYKTQTGKNFDKRTKLEVYSDLKKVNNKIKVSVSVPASGYYILKNYNLLPLAGTSNSETIHCNENGYYSIYQSDRYGFNNPDSEWDNEEVEYFLIGDSFTHGACLNRPNDIASILRVLSDKTVLNLGYSGNSSLIEYATLREYFKPNIKKVLWIYYENDLEELNNELKNKILKNYLNDLTFTQNLKLKQNEIDILANKAIEIAKEREINIKIKEEQKARTKESFKYNFFKFIKIYNLRSSIISKPRPQMNEQTQTLPFQKFKKILKLTKNLTDKNKSTLYFVYLPSYSRYKTKYNNSNYLSIKKILKELDIPIVDIHEEVFNKNKNPLKFFPFGLYGHYTVDGYKKVAETIYKFTKD
jgi:hypothetical protein